MSIKSVIKPLTCEPALLSVASLRDAICHGSLSRGTLSRVSRTQGHFESQNACCVTRCAVSRGRGTYFLVALAEPAREMKMIVDTERMRKVMVRAPTPVEPTSSMVVHADGARLSAVTPYQCQPLLSHLTMYAFISLTQLRELLRLLSAASKRPLSLSRYSVSPCAAPHQLAPI